MDLIDRDRLPNWILQFVDIVRGAGESGISQSAAGLAYYTLFSIFPLVTVLIAVGSRIFNSKKIVAEITPVIINLVPVSNQFIDRNFSRLVDLSNTVGVISLLTLVWSASNVFTVLNRNINQVWQGSQERGYIEKRLVAFAIIAMLVLMLFVYILSVNTIQILLTQNPLGVPGAKFFTTLLWDVLNLLIPLLIVFSMVFMLYYWIPNTKVPMKAAVISSTIAVVLLWALSKGFAWFVSSGLLNYEVVYGSLSTLIIFLLYIYLSSLVILFGNHLAAGIASS